MIEVKYRQHVGDDASICAITRGTIKTQDGMQRTSDMALIDYMIRHRHTSPFEMAQVIIDFKVPNFIAEQHLRHRTGAYQKLSLRYSVFSDSDLWKPETVRGRSSGRNKQSSEDNLNYETKEYAGSVIADASSAAIVAYENLIDCGVCNEQARTVLPCGFMTQYTCSMSLHNWLHFLRLRLHEDSQSEMREVARGVFEIIKGLFPITVRSWENHVLYSLTLSADEISMIRRKDKVAFSGLSKSRQIEVKKKSARLLGNRTWDFDPSTGEWRWNDV